MKLNGMMLAAMILTGACSAPAANGPRPEAAYFSSAERHETASPAMIERNYLACLVSDNNGTVESAIAHLVKIKLDAPAYSSTKTRETLRKLAMEGRTQAIRYKAYLAGLVMDDPEGFRVSGCRSCETPRELFAAVASFAEESALSETP